MLQEKLQKAGLTKITHTKPDKCQNQGYLTIYGMHHGQEIMLQSFEIGYTYNKEYEVNKLLDEIGGKYQYFLEHCNDLT